MEFVSPAAIMKKLFGSNSSSSTTSLKDSPGMEPADHVLESSSEMVEPCSSACGDINGSFLGNPEDKSHEPVQNEEVIESHEDNPEIDQTLHNFASSIEGDVTSPKDVVSESLDASSACAITTQTDNTMRHVEESLQNEQGSTNFKGDDIDTRRSIDDANSLKFDRECVAPMQSTECSTVSQGSLESADTPLPNLPTPNEVEDECNYDQTEMNTEKSAALDTEAATTGDVAPIFHALDEQSAFSGPVVFEANGEMANSNKPDECDAKNLSQYGTTTECSTVINQAFSASEYVVEDATYRLQTLAQVASAGSGRESSGDNVHEAGTDGEDGEAETEGGEFQDGDDSESEDEDGTEGSWAAVGALISGRRSERSTCGAQVNIFSAERKTGVTEEEHDRGIEVSGEQKKSKIEEEMEAGSGTEATAGLAPADSANYRGFSEQQTVDSNHLGTKLLQHDTEGMATFTNEKLNKSVSPRNYSSGNEGSSAGMSSNGNNSSTGGLTAWIKNKVLGHQTPATTPIESLDFSRSEDNYEAMNNDEETISAEVDIDDTVPSSDQEVKTAHSKSTVAETPRRAWTESETEALRHGMAVHGHRSHKWARIKADPEFQSLLMDRTNVQLKDRWRSKACNLMESRTDFIANEQTCLSPSNLLGQQPSQRFLQGDVYQPKISWTTTDLMVPEALLGRSVVKQLADGCIDGVVTAYVEPYWEITYVDGEEEDLDQNEVLSLLNSTSKTSMADVVTPEPTSNNEEVSEVYKNVSCRSSF